MVTISTSRLSSTVVAVLFAAPAFADRPIFGDTFNISIGGMEQRAKATFQATREGNPPIELNMSDLDMDRETTTVWGGISWQFAENWGVSAIYSSFDSKGTALSTSDGNFGDIGWSANTTLTSDLNLDLYIVDLHWDFINTDRSHLGVGLGLHIADLSTGIGAVVAADSNGTPVPVVDLGTETAAVTAPLPDISIRGGHRFGESFYVGGTAAYFSLKVGDIDGELTSLRATAEWRPGAGRFSVGAGYQYVDMKVTDKTASELKKYHMKFYGPVLFVGIGF